MQTDRKNTANTFNCPNCGAAAASDSVQCPYCHSGIATRVCPSCFGPVAVGMQHCPSCGSKTEGTPLGQPTTLQCPRCRKKLSVVSAGAHQLHECPECGGLWVSAADFQEICTRLEDQEAVLAIHTGTEVSPDSAARLAQRAYVPCPECGRLMNRKNFAGCSGIVLDWCRDHGCWFDRRELQLIITFIRNGGLRKSRERELARIQDEKLQLRAQQYTMNTLAGLAGVEPVSRLESAQAQDPLLKALCFLFRDIGSG